MTVARSSNTVSAGAADYWATTSNIVSGSPGSWIVLAHATGAQWLWVLDQGASNAHRGTWYVSYAAGFTGGSTSARPTATDEHSLGVQHWTANDTADVYFHVWHSSDGKNTRIVSFSAGDSKGFWALEDVDTGLSAGQWALPVFAIANLTATYGLGLTWEDMGVARGRVRYRIGTTNSADMVFSPRIFSQTDAGNLYLHPTWAKDPLTNRYGMTRLIWMNRSADPTMYGEIPDLWMGCYNLPQKYNNAFPASGTRKLTQIDHFVLPWDTGVAIQTGSATAEARYDAAITPSEAATGTGGSASTAPTFAGITSAVAAGRTSVSLGWSAATPGSEDVDHYDVHCATSASATWETRRQAAGTSLTFDGLLPGTTYYFRARAVDVNGLVSDGADVELSATTTADTAPSITIVSPTVGSELNPSSTIVIRVTDDVGLGGVPIYVSFPEESGYKPTYVHDGDGFHPDFAGSTRAAISGGYEYQIRYTGGWPAAPTIKLRPFDSAAQEPAA
jgi:hypothetical protein